MRKWWTTGVVGLLALSLAVMTHPARAGTESAASPYRNGGGHETNGREPAFQYLDIGRIVARQRAEIYWMRFSPFLMALEQGGNAKEAIRAFISPASGENAMAEGWSLWLSASPADLHNRLPATRAKGYTILSTLGLDKQVSPRLTLGLGLDNGYSRVRTIHNNGHARTRNHGLNLFLHYRFNDWLSADVQGGYVYQHQKLDRRNAITLFLGRRHSHGTSGSAALNAAKWLSSSILLSGRLGLIGSYTKWGRYTEQSILGVVPRPGTKEKLLQGVVEAGVGLWQEGFMPYLKASYNYDLYRKGGVHMPDRDDFTFTGGFYLFGPKGTQGLSLGASGSVIVGRSKQRHYLSALQLKWSW